MTERGGIRQEINEVQWPMSRERPAILNVTRIDIKRKKVFVVGAG